MLVVGWSTVPGGTVFVSSSQSSMREEDLLPVSLGSNVCWRVCVVLCVHRSAGASCIPLAHVE